LHLEPNARAKRLLKELPGLLRELEDHGLLAAARPRPARRGGSHAIPLSGSRSPESFAGSRASSPGQRSKVSPTPRETTETSSVSWPTRDCASESWPHSGGAVSTSCACA
jgi:hypothetical protein